MLHQATLRVEITQPFRVKTRIASRGVLEADPRQKQPAALVSDLLLILIL